MQSSHAVSSVSASFSDPNLIASAGLVPLVRLAERWDLPALVRRHVDLGVTTGANPAGKAMSLVAAMCAGADSIDDAEFLRCGGLDRLFHGSTPRPRSGPSCAPSRTGRCASCRPPPAGSELAPRKRPHLSAQRFERGLSSATCKPGPGRTGSAQRWRADRDAAGSARPDTWDAPRSGRCLATWAGQIEPGGLYSCESGPANGRGLLCSRCQVSTLL